MIVRHMPSSYPIGRVSRVCEPRSPAVCSRCGRQQTRPRFWRIWGAFFGEVCARPPATVDLRTLTASSQTTRPRNSRCRPEFSRRLFFAGPRGALKPSDPRRLRSVGISTAADLVEQAKNIQPSTPSKTSTGPGAYEVPEPFDLMRACAALRCSVNPELRDCWGAGCLPSIGERHRGRIPVS
jgi:hypothetical protein